MILRIAQLVPDTEAEGPGKRFAVWVQGCPIRCPGCCNPEMFTDQGGTDWDVATLAARIIGTPGIEGLTFLGGEPFAQAAAAAALAATVRAAGLSVMVFTGYTLADLRTTAATAATTTATTTTATAGHAALLAATDLLVDGRYERDQPEPPVTAGGRRWIGSRNQVMHHLTTRYSPDDPRLTTSNTVEIRLDANGSGITINGWPSASASFRPRS